MTRRQIVLVLMMLGGITSTGIAQNAWQWCQRTFSGPSVSNPHVRAHTSVVYDSNRKVMVFFGGYYRQSSHPNTKYYYNDTWERDEAYWKQISPTNPIPSKRYCHTLAYDSARGVTVLFGGHDGTNALSDTWEWNGTQWTQLKPASSPPARNNHALAYDSARGVTVLFGGHDGTNYFSDTWEWNGKNWVQKNISGPYGNTGIVGMDMAYDVAHRCIVLFGGKDSNDKVYGNTYVYDGTSWTIKFLAGSPKARHHHAMAYDLALRRTVVFGGLDNNSQRLSDTHAWDGAAGSWIPLSTQPSPAGIPSARYGHAMAYDANLGEVIVFGGYDGSYRSDTWALSCITKPGTQLAGFGHSGGGLGLRCEDPQKQPTPPKIGTTFYASILNSRTAAAGFNLLVLGPAALSPYWKLDPPIVPVQGYLHVLPMAVFQNTGNPTYFPFPIPSLQNLVGQKVWIQGGSYESTGTFRLTDALEITIQK